MGPADQIKSEAKNTQENDTRKESSSKDEKGNGNSEAKMTKKQRKQQAQMKIFDLQQFDNLFSCENTKHPI